MFTKRRIEAKLDEILAYLRAERDLNDKLLKMNQDLLDRLMARNFQELKLMTPTQTQVQSGAPVFDNFDNEEFAGRIISGDSESE